MITVSEENLIDYEVTARIATEAFRSKEVLFSAERMKWLYERSFGQGTTIVSVSDEGAKIGQIALIHQIIYSDGEPCVAAQLVDLFILRSYRSPPLIRRVYKEVERLCLAQNIRFILAMPNEKSGSLNARFLKLKPALWLQIRAGIGLRGPRPSKLKYSGHLKSMTKTAAIDLLSGFATAAVETGLRWDGETLFNRTNDPTCDGSQFASIGRSVR